MDAAQRKRQLRAVVLGAGLMGSFHADAIARAGGTLVAIVDPDLERARRLAGRAEAFASLDELGDRRDRVDVVHVCAPLTEHTSLVERALALGANLVVEKPFAPDAATTAALLATAEERRLFVVPVHQFLFQRGVQRLLASRHHFDPLVRCVFEATTAGAERTSLDPDDLVADILPHPLALFSRFASGVLPELEWQVVRPAPGELRALAICAGTTFEIAISTRARPTRATLDLLGSRASAHADLFHGFAVVERGGASRVRKLARPFTLAGATLGRAGGNLAVRAIAREVAYPGLRELVLRTYEAIASGSPPPIDAQETLAVARARDAILSVPIASSRWALTAAAAPAPGRTPP